MLFRKKRFRFQLELRQHLGIPTASSAALKLELNRAQMFEETFHKFQRFSKKELCQKPRITFENEDGIDSGGLTKVSLLCTSQPSTEYN